MFAIALFANLQAAMMALSQKANFKKDMNETIVAVRKASEECHNFTKSAMKGIGSNLLLQQLEFFEKGATFQFGNLQNSLLALTLILE